MLNIPCPFPCITCEPAPPGASGLGLSPNDPSNPFVNISSEAPDVDLFLGRRYGGQLPPLGSTWYSVGCLGFCLSTESQEDADVCAENQVALCQSVNWPVPNPVEGASPPFVPRDLFTNSAQFCSFTCPDGNLYTFTVAAGYFLAFSVAAANSLASSYACRQARLNRICFGEMQNRRSCIEGTLFASVAVSSANLPINFSIVSGAIPAGTAPVQVSPSALLITGVPEIAGDYPLRIRATDRFGNFMEKDFEIIVFGITNDNELPDAVIGEAYSQQLNYAGTPTSAVEFTLNGGAFPDGITMDSSGLISGTPTVGGAFQVTIGASDSFEECDKTFDLFSDSGGCSLFSEINWAAPVISFFGAASASGSASLNSVSFSGSAGPTAGAGFNFSVTGTMPYSGGELVCDVELDASAISSSTSCGGGSNGLVISIIVTSDIDGIIFAYAISNTDGSGDAPGVYTNPITIPISVGAILTFLVETSGGTPDCNGSASSSGVVTFGS